MPMTSDNSTSHGLQGEAQSVSLLLAAIATVLMWDVGFVAKFLPSLLIQMYVLYITAISCKCIMLFIIVITKRY